mgnify:CR=1 FL=1
MGFILLLGAILFVIPTGFLGMSVGLLGARVLTASWQKTSGSAFALAFAAQMVAGIAGLVGGFVLGGLFYMHQLEGKAGHGVAFDGLKWDPKNLKVLISLEVVLAIVLMFAYVWSYVDWLCVKLMVPPGRSESWFGRFLIACVATLISLPLTAVAVVGVPLFVAWLVS